MIAGKHRFRFAPSALQANVKELHSIGFEKHRLYLIDGNKKQNKHINVINLIIFKPILELFSIDRTREETPFQSIVNLIQYYISYNEQ